MPSLMAYSTWLATAAADDQSPGGTPLGCLSGCALYLSGYACKACAHADRERGVEMLEIGIGASWGRMVDLLAEVSASRSPVYGYELCMLVKVVLCENRNEGSKLHAGGGYIRDSD